MSLYDLNNSMFVRTIDRPILSTFVLMGQLVHRGPTPHAAPNAFEHVGHQRIPEWNADAAALLCWEDLTLNMGIRLSRSFKARRP